MSNYFIIEYEFADNAFAELEGPDISFWDKEGSPLFINGSINSFALIFPEYFAELVLRRLVKHTGEK